MAKLIDQADGELAAIGTVLRALEGLDGESIQRVLDYVFGRLSISGPKPFKASVVSNQSLPIASQAKSRRESVRDLKDEKQPESSNQMAALVAYYLSELADDDQGKETINTADLERYFKQAGFKLPKSISQTLPNATAAGYFDAVGGGQYKLNAVGYNLVVHGLPRNHGVVTKRTRSTAKRVVKKKVVAPKKVAKKSRKT